jgi:peptidoglycan/xylan/chitin deacetylase (PgdA/CDA1 family)
LLRVLESLPRGACLVVLNYHRIGSIEENPFDDSVFTATAVGFRDQVRYLRLHFDMPSLEELVERSKRGLAVRRPTALITFDDGYRDNFKVALPILMDLGVPAAFFIPTDYIDRPRLPWWDHVAYVLKHTRKDSLQLDFPRPFSVGLPEKNRSQAVWDTKFFYNWGGGQEDSPRFFRELEERAEVPIDSEACARDLFMTWGEIRSARDSGMTFGTHTHRHLILGTLQEADQADELAQSKRLLERQLGETVETMSYPSGRRERDFTAVTERLAQEAGYQMAFSFYGGVNRPARFSPYDVRRMNAYCLDHEISLFRARMVLRTLLDSSPL